MNSALALDEGLICRAERPEGLLSFLVSRAKNAPRSLTPSTSEVLNGCADAVNQILRAAIETRTRTEFSAVFLDAFPKYAAIGTAVSHFATAVIQKQLREQLVRESICELEADFRDKGLEVFGAKVRDQALFTIWTLRKINELTAQIIAVPATAVQGAQDQEYCSHFNLNALRAQFSIDCLSMSLEIQQPIYPEVLEELIEGLRAMVNAYAWARRGLDLRVPIEEPVPDISLMDEEGAALEDMSFSEASEWLNGERTADGLR